MKNIFNLLLFFLIKIIPKKKNILVFGDRAGRRFADNSRHLFIYINRYHKEFRPIWITKNKNIYEFLKKENYEVFFSNSIKGIFYCLIANWHLFNFVEDDINKVITKYSKCVFLWHGVPPKKLKKIEYKKNEINNFIFKKIKKFFVYPNKSLGLNLLKRFPDHKYDLLISNLPRNLILKKKNHNLLTPNEFRLINEINFSKKKIYGYIPTWRQDGLEIFRDLKNLKKFKDLDDSLNKTGSVILLKKHMNSEIIDGDSRYNSDIEKMINELKKYKSIIFVNYDIDLNTILNKCDYLITDYSGCVFDYLYLERPIILYVPDYEFFLKNTGFDINIVKKKISKVAYNFDELVKIILENKDEKSQENPEYDINRKKLKEEIFPENNQEIENIIKILRNN